ncbi:right-handed parallel beta-helix repeat-containing protein [Sorangium sp. KYC3313]|uniref:right-handed parallel beta-helix repeat-containing protein n=1 Tax=Sorangium sp. KYC3313 TaxID=3449740 RepID=UPI003F8BCCDD
MVVWSWSLVAALVTLDCGGVFDAKPCATGEVAREDGQCEPKPCGPGELTLATGACQPAGLPPDMRCAPGEIEQEDGRCQPAGVPPEACGEGFVADGRGGCSAILPDAACPKGQMAIPGETRCHEVASCGEGPWGDIPIEASTQLVDQAYTGGDSDGTAARPWTTIQRAINKANSGAIVAVAAGTYEEDVLISGKAVRLWGRCPGLVEIQGTGNEGAALRVLRTKASGTEIRSLAVTGTKLGILISRAHDVTIDKAWVHDAEMNGIEINGSDGATSASITTSLLEQNHDSGVSVLASDAAIKGTVIRGTKPSEDRSEAAGLAVAKGAGVTVRTSVIEQNHATGALIMGSNATFETTVIRETQPNSNNKLGRGIEVQSTSDTGERAVASVRACLIENNHDIGILVSGGDATIEATVVRSTRLRPDGTRGRGIEVQYDSVTGERASATVSQCLIEQNNEVGVFVAGSRATIQASIVRATQPNSSGEFGRGIEAGPVEDERANLTVHACIVEKNHDAGVFVLGSDATVEATIVGNTRSTAKAEDAAMMERGVGIRVQNGRQRDERANIAIRACLVEENRTAGVLVVGSDATIETSVVRATQPGSDGQLGRGIGVESRAKRRDRANVTIRACLVEENHEAGVGVIDSDATIDSTLVRTTKALGGNAFGHGVAAADESTTWIYNTSIAGNVHIGVANYGSDVAIVDTSLTCNEIDISGEDAPFAESTFDRSDRWRCTSRGAAHCSETEDNCSVSSHNVPPVPRMGPAQEAPQG